MKSSLTRQRVEVDPENCQLEIQANQLDQVRALLRNGNYSFSEDPHGIRSDGRLAAGIVLISARDVEAVQALLDSVD